MKNLIFFLLLAGNSAFSQTTNKNLNRDLKTYREAVVEKKFEQLAELIYPKSFDLIGGKANSVMMLKMADTQMSQNGVSLIRITHQNAGKLLKYKDELQIPLDEVTLVKTKDQKIPATSRIIAVSNDNGKNWKFINTMNQPKSSVLKLFPNLNPEIEIHNKAVQKEGSVNLK